MINRLTVILDQDIDEVSIQPLIAAIRLFSGVLRVEQNVADPGDLLAYARASREWEQKLVALMHDMRH